MKTDIIQAIENPLQLEALYRKDKVGFEQAFNAIYDEHKENANLQYWNIRLNYKEEKLSIGFKNEIGFIILLAIIAGLFANISNLPNVNIELFFTRNAAFLIIPFITAYFIFKQHLFLKTKVIVGILLLLLACYINLLPNNPMSSSITLVYIHLPMLLWSILGYAYLGNAFLSNEKRINFLKFNGDLLIMSVIIFLSCVLFTVITFGLFNLIGIKVENFYIQYIAIWGIGAIPLFAAYLIYNNPNLINRITPLIAKIFTPLVFINLFIYLVTLIYLGKYPHNDRNLLLVYNLLLVAVLALIFFSIAEQGTGKGHYFSSILLFGLSILTIIINGIALSAISFRIVELGVTPNRMAVLGGNILIFIHLIMVSFNLLNVIRNKSNSLKVAHSIAKYLPVYALWAAIVVLIFPILFGWK
jgi:hypothetical protein